MALKIQKTENTGVIYADPADPTMVVRFRSTSSPKSLNGVTTKNYLTEIIYNVDNDVTINGVASKDAVSVRIRTSGALQSKQKIKQLLVSAAAQVDDWADEDVFVGFNPVTVPAILP